MCDIASQTPIELKNKERRAIVIFSLIVHHQRGPTKWAIKEKNMNYQTKKGEIKPLPF